MWAAALPEAGLRLCGPKDSDPPDLFAPVSLSLLLASLPPSDMLMAHIIFPFHQPKKKIPPGFSDSSLSLDEVPAIYIFVDEKGDINRARAECRRAGCLGLLTGS